MQPTPKEGVTMIVKESVWAFMHQASICLRDKAACFIRGLLYENGTPSLTRFISVVSFFAFLAGSAYLMINGKRWDHYETFAVLTCGGGAATQIANKIVNSIYNSPSSQFPDKQGGNING